jgi:DDE superfamily endonuclease
MNKEVLDLYTDYLISSFSYTTATGLSNALDGAISHDKITRFLSEEDYGSKQLWQLVKPIIREIESEEGIIIFDDTIEEKPYTDENSLITWHYDHTAGRAVKGVNILSALYHSQGMNIPFIFQLIQKTEQYTDKKTGKERKKSVKTKNEYLREMARLATFELELKYKWIVADGWFSANDTMEFIKFELKKEFVMPIKANRLIALSLAQKNQGLRPPSAEGSQFQQVGSYSLEPNIPCIAYIKELPFPVLLVKQVFKNEDGSVGVLYLACSDLTVGVEQVKSVYQRRWHIEEYHKSLKSNVGLGKSPTKTIRTQENHFFSAICA